MPAHHKAKILRFPKPVARVGQKPIPKMGVGGGKCECCKQEDVPLGTKTGLGHNCLAWLSKVRRENAAWMLQYKRKQAVRQARIDEAEAFPKGYKNGRLIEPGAE